VGIAITRINASPEVMTRIWMQLCDFKDAIQMPDDRKEALFQWAIDLIRKLETVKYHRDNLLRVVSDQFERGSDPDRANHTFIEINTAAEKEFEAFLLQGKSTLDVLVKVFVPLFNIKLHSYGDGGEKVSRTLKRNLSAELLARAQHLLTLVEEDKGWIEKWFGSHRDTVAHYKPISSSGFVTPPINDDAPRHAPPATSDGVSFHEAVVVLYENLLTFAEDFLALAVNVAIMPVFTVGTIPVERRDKEYPRKWGLAFASPPGAT
jgi:hypothetical protein